MSEYEIASLFYQIVQTAHAALANYLTVVFAVLISSYFVASKLERSAWIFLLGVYSIFAIGMTNEIISLYSDMVRLGWEISEYSRNSGSELSWHGFSLSASHGPRWAIPVIVSTMCALSYIGSLFFFFRIRSQGLKAG